MRVRIYDGDKDNGLVWWADLEKPTVDCLLIHMKNEFDWLNEIHFLANSTEIMRGGRSVPLNREELSKFKFTKTINTETTRPLLEFKAHYSKGNSRSHCYPKVWLEVSLIDEQSKQVYPLVADKNGRLLVNEKHFHRTDAYFQKADFRHQIQ